jgi:predicted TPR repeat methyltransferase
MSNPVPLPDVFDARDARDAVRTWAATEPRLAVLLQGGEPAEALQRWGLQLFAGGQLADAEMAFRAAATLVPDSPTIWTNLGVILDRAGSSAQAAASLERSVALSRRQPDTWLLLGIVRQKTGDRAGAERAFREAIEQQPTSAPAWQCLGVLKQEERDYGQAIACFAACIDHGDASPANYANVGKLCYQTCRVAEAHDAYDRAARGDPDNAQYRRMVRSTRFVLDVLEGAAVDDALATYRASVAASGAGSTSAGGAVDANLAELFEGTCGLLGSFGHAGAALRASRKRLELWPGSASARYLLQAIVGEAGIDRTPPKYIVESFDAFAPGFDAKLVGALGYDVPEKLCAAIQRATTPGPAHDVLDAGCGTGLCGPLLRPLARAGGLWGADLSSKMLERAAGRGVYDTLVREELTALLGRSTGRFDLVVAADVLIYFGDLAPVFAVAATAIRPGGILAISTERSDGDGFRLRASGRFAHAPAYVRAVAHPAFREASRIETTIRLEASERLAGDLFLFRRC